jgi:hypothetical protein
VIACSRVVVAFNIAGAAEPVARETFLHTDDHGVDAVPAFALQHRIEIDGALGPGPGDEITATAAVGLVPLRDIAIDQRIHVRLLHWRTRCSAWTHFSIMYTGNPNLKGDAPWPRYTAGSKVYLSENVPHLSTITEAQFRAAHRCEFWDTVLIY